jgi:hypothetical protein
MAEDDVRVTTKGFKDSNGWRQCHADTLVANNRRSGHSDCAPISGVSALARVNDEQGGPNGALHGDQQAVARG